MADEVLEFLRVSFARLNERPNRIEAGMAEFRERLGHIEGQIAGTYGMYATMSSRMDRMDRRLERIERRRAGFADTIDVNRYSFWRHCPTPASQGT